MRVKCLLFAMCCLGTQAALGWDNLDLGGLPLEENRRTHVVADDGVPLAAWLLVPERPVSGRLPAVVFAEDWLSGDQHLLLPAVQLALRGHVVLLYQARGSGHSAGQYDLAGPDSQRDLRSVYHWLAAHPRVDAQRMGILGASGSATTALLGAADLPGLRTMVALCPWVDLGAAVYHEGVGRPAWLDAFARSTPLRRLQKGLLDQLQRTLVNAPDPDWLRIRSPAALPVRPAMPVLLTGTFSDPLQDASAVMTYAAGLTGTRQLMLFQGGHCAAAQRGLEQAALPLWEDVLAWLEHWLSTDAQSPPVAHLVMETAADGSQDEWLGWPASPLAQMQLYLGPRIGGTSGSLEPQVPEGKRRFSNTLQGIRNGVQELQQIEQEGGRGELALWLPGIDKNAAIAFESRGLARTLHLRGAPQLRLWVLSSGREIQLVAYLFSSTELGLGRLIGKGAVARAGLLPGEPFPLDLRLQTTARDIEPGNHLVLVLDTDDPDYLLPVQRNFSLRLLFSMQHQSVLQIPYAGVPAAEYDEQP